MPGIKGTEMTTLCYAKKTCSVGIHVLMEEIGAPYDLKIVDFSKGEQKTPEYKALNPKGKVAALVREDGSVLTEYAAIALWLAMTNPDKKLVPTDPGTCPDNRSIGFYCWHGSHVVLAPVASSGCLFRQSR